jgi:hypothetical protein
MSSIRVRCLRRARIWRVQATAIKQSQHAGEGMETPKPEAPRTIRTLAVPKVCPTDIEYAQWFAKPFPEWEQE